MLAILTLTLAFAISQEPATRPPAAQPAAEPACGPASEKLKNETDKSTHPEPSVPQDKALVYVVRPTMMGNKVQTKFAVDGKWVGVNRGNNYFFVFLDPGPHRFCSQAENSESAPPDPGNRQGLLFPPACRDGLSQSPHLSRTHRRGSRARSSHEMPS